MHGTGFSAKDDSLFLSAFLPGKPGGNVTCLAVSKLPLKFQSTQNTIDLQINSRTFSFYDLCPSFQALFVEGQSSSMLRFSLIL
jgi:hypothetical protein